MRRDACAGESRSTDTSALDRSAKHVGCTKAGQPFTTCPDEEGTPLVVPEPPFSAQSTKGSHDIGGERYQALFAALPAEQHLLRRLQA
jgi:hypothetical protein